MSFPHPTLNLYCEINSTLLHPSLTWPQNLDRKQRLLFSRSSSCVTGTLQNMHIHLIAVRRANLEQYFGQKVKGQREYWPLTSLDPIYWYNGRTAVLTPCHRGVRPQMNRFRHTSVKPIRRLIQLPHKMQTLTPAASFKKLCLTTPECIMTNH